MGSSQSIPAFFKTIQGFTESSSIDAVCTSEPLAIQYAIQQLPEFKNTYTVKIKDITNIPDNNLQCDVQFMYSSPETGFTKNEIRRVTFIKTPEGDPIVDSISRRLNEINEPTAVSSKEVLEYYNILSKYNQNWIKSGWKLKNASYNPPLPLWNDPIFMKNIDIYNNNFNIVIGKIKDSATTSDGTELFKKYIAPLPADPIPPKASKILLPVKQLAGSDSGSYVDETAIDAALAAESNAAMQNAETISNAQTSYNNYNIPRDSPMYDPPLEGDDYETVLIKLIKGYDYVTSQVSDEATNTFFSETRDERLGDSIPNKYDRRLLGRHIFNSPDKKFRVPNPILPQNTVPLDYNNSIGYTFTKRQQYLIDYAPTADSNDKAKLKENMCKSLGFQPWSNENQCGSAGDCCAPLQTLPKYSGSAPATEGFASASAQPGSASASAPAPAKKCGRNGIQLGGRTLTVSVPSPPVNIDTSNRMFTYKMTRPTNGTCKPASTPKPSPDELYDALRPVFLKELQTTMKNNKMFELRCPGSCLN